MHAGQLLKMAYIGEKGFKRMYSCQCGTVCGIERNSKGKMPYCDGEGRVVFRDRAE